MSFSRYIEELVLKDLEQKMVFMAGPRQCGKTTLSQRIQGEFPYAKNRKGLYLNWDDDDHRRKILKREWGIVEELIVFDEIHKFPRWKNWLKGLYDVQKHEHKFLVTGSARLNIYKKGGDSLLGRYHSWRLHPFSLSEPVKGISQSEAFKRLMRVGGFPEPFLDGSEVEAKRWRKDRFEKVLREDIRDLTHVEKLAQLSLLVDLLRERVGNLVVVSNLAEDLHVAPKTVSQWLEILEQMFIIFRIYPYSKNIARGLQKPAKVYFYDNADVRGDEGAIFENFVASHLLKQIHFLEDSKGDEFKLCYIRDKEKREVDFAIIKNHKLEKLIEAKWSDKSISPSLQYFSERLKPPSSIQIVGQLKEDAIYSKGQLMVTSPLVFFRNLEIF